jgi:class 3 adenylate cyclase
VSAAAEVAVPSSASPVQVLVVDDEPDLELLMRQRFRKAIQAGRYQFHFAGNGVRALEFLEKRPDIEVILSDLNMPEMDGLTLLGETKRRYPLLRTVVISAYGDLATIRRAMNSGAFDFVTKPVDFGDLEKTIDKTALLVRELRESADTQRENSVLKMFVDDSVTSYMKLDASGAASARNEHVDLAVAFLDICSFTTLSERNPPETVIRLLNRYFDTIVSCVVAYDGHVDKFIGDAVMATFAGPDRAEHAVHAALDAGRYIRAMRGDIEQQIGFFPDIATGIHMGRVVAGPVGARSLGRLDFTVIGDVVNTAARLQRLAIPGEVVITTAVRESLSEGTRVRPRGLHSLRGKAEPLELWSVRQEGE